MTRVDQLIKKIKEASDDNSCGTLLDRSAMYWTILDICKMCDINSLDKLTFEAVEQIMLNRESESGYLVKVMDVRDIMEDHFRAVETMSYCRGC